MKFFIVLLAILKYTLLVILFLLLLVLVFTLILMISPIRYKAVINYKNKNLYYNVDVTYLGKIVGFKIKGVKNKFKTYVRLLHKTVYLKSDDEQKSKKQTKKKSKSASSSNSEKRSKANKESVYETKSKNTDDKDANFSEPNLPLDIAQKITPTTTLEEAVSTSDTMDIHNSEDIDVENNSLSDNYVNIESNSKTSADGFTENKESADKENTNKKSNDDCELGDDGVDEKSKEEAEEEKVSFIGKINIFFKNINFYIESYKTYPYRDKLFKKFKKIFTNIKDAVFPKVFDFSGKIYVHDPSITGQILGFLYMLHGLNRTFNVDADADFETEKNDFTVLISGRVIIIKLVYPVVSFVWLGLKAEAKRRKISRFKLIKILINNE